MITLSEMPTAVFTVFLAGHGQIYVHAEDAARSILREFHGPEDYVTITRYSADGVPGGDLTEALRAVVIEIGNPPIPGSPEVVNGAWMSSTEAWREKAVATIREALVSATPAPMTVQA